MTMDEKCVGQMQLFPSHCHNALLSHAKQVAPPQVATAGHCMQQTFSAIATIFCSVTRSKWPHRRWLVEIALVFLLASDQDAGMEEISEVRTHDIQAGTSASKGGRARMQSLSPQQKKMLGKKAAKARWSKAKKSSAVAGIPQKAIAETRKPHTRETRVFSIALTAAEKRLAKAIEERARAASTWAVLNAEIPSLQRTIAALRNQQNPDAPMVAYQMQLPDGSPAEYRTSPANYDLNTVLSDAPMPVLSPRPLAASRAGGGALNINLGDNEEEDKFLNESGIAGGQWH